jgi:hypothetical protein
MDGALLTKRGVSRSLALRGVRRAVVRSGRFAVIVESSDKPHILFNGPQTSYTRRRVLKEYSFTKSAFIGQDDGYGVGWELYSNLYGKAHDHNVASGGHNKALFDCSGTSTKR